MSKSKSRQTFETYDLHLASFLRCRGFNLTDIRRENGRVVFRYDHSPVLRQAIVDYANDGEVAVRSFCNTLRDLKALTRQAAELKSDGVESQPWANA